MNTAPLSGLSEPRSPLLVQVNGKTMLWKEARPMAIGHPFRFVLERTTMGVRIRDLVRSQSIELHSSDIARSTSLVLPNSNTRLSIWPARETESVIETLEHSSSPVAHDPSLYWTVFKRRGTVVESSQALQFPFSAKVLEKEIFRIEKTGATLILVPAIEGLTIQSQPKHETQSLQPQNRYELSLEHRSFFYIRLGNLSWIFSLASAPKIAAHDTIDLALQVEISRFNKSLRVAFSGLLSILLLSIVWPKTEKKDEPLIPPQFTKIVMMKQSRASAPKMDASLGSHSEKAMTAQAHHSKVVQAFRSKALQNAVKGLLKGGMTTLMAQGNLLAGSSVSQARAMMNSKAEQGLTSAPIVGLNRSKSVNVASIGSSGTAGGKGVGYGKGEAGKVSGQGQSFVSLDLGHSSVEEGLTKDEVGRVIHSHMSEIRYCYESTMLASPDLEGKLVLDFTISSQGSIQVASVRESSLRDPRLDDCVVRRLTKWQFPKPKGGVVVAVTYPFIFKTLGR